MENTPRYPRLTPVQMSPRQHEVAKDIIERRAGPLSDPWAAMLHSPEAAALIHPLWHRLRYGLRLPEPVRFMAVLMTAARRNAADAALFLTKDTPPPLSNDKI